MLQEQVNEVINISSDEEETDESAITNYRMKKFNSPAQRQSEIKEDIVAESFNIDTENIVLIDNVENDSIPHSSVSSIIEKDFGTAFFQEFLLENFIFPAMHLNYVPNSDSDIITCPVCAGKMKRSLYSNHINGCMGAAKKVVLPKRVLPKMYGRSSLAATTPSVVRPHHSRSRIEASATTANISISSSDDDAGSTAAFAGNSSATTTVLDSSQEDLENTKRFRMRNVLKTSRQCPGCGTEVEAHDQPIQRSFGSLLIFESKAKNKLNIYLI